MKNHLHVLLKEDKEPIGDSMRRVCSSFVLWYNKKYDRPGHLFQGRFKSEPVEDNTYFLTVLRYILRNPVKADTTDKVDDYRWSNYRDYLGKGKDIYIDSTLEIFHKDR